MRRRRLCTAGTGACLLFSLALFAGSSGYAVEPEVVPAPAAAPAPAPPALTGVGVARHAGGTVVSLDGSVPLPYEYFLLEGRNLVIELPGAANLVQPPERPVGDDPFVSRVRIAEVGDPRPGVRVVIDLKEAVRFTVGDDGPHIVVALGAPAGAPPAAPAGKPAAAPPAVPAASPAPVPEAPPRARVTGVEPLPGEGRFRVLVKTEGAPPYDVLESGEPTRIVLAVRGAELDPAARLALDLAPLAAAVTRVGLQPERGVETGVRVEIDLRAPAVYQVRRDRDGILVVVTNPIPAPASAAGPKPAAPATAAVKTPAPPADPQAAAPAVHAGNPVTLDFVDADIDDILRLLAEVSGVNLIWGDEVKGKRTVHMIEVPWEQALDLILKTNTPQLVQVRETEKVLRITTQKRVIDEQTDAEEKKLKLIKIQQEQRDQELRGRENEQLAAIRMLELEEKERGKQLEERKRQEPMVRRVFAISYGDAKTIAERLKTYVSDHPGLIFEHDPRTNTIVVQDIAPNIAIMEDVLAFFDAPTPAVMVEARIVEVDSDSTSSLGIQWGGKAVANASHGNATGYAFPNSFALGGGVVQGEGGINPGSYLVNAPAANAVGGVALSLGHIADTLSLDVRLSALEKLGKTKILSNPKVLVIQNEDAKINVGQQLPVPKTDAEGNRTVEWKDVGILLAVKPQVTNDGRVFMKLNIEKSRQGESVPTTEGTMFSIDTSRAETKVIVGDGETSVIGGIFIQTAIDGQTGVPGLARIPLLGALFRSRDKQDNRKELMIFLTPRIVTNP